MHTVEHVNARAFVRANSPQVIHETIDGEVIAIDLTTGSYYSLKGSAAEAWALIGRPGGIGGRDLLDALATRFDAPASDVEAAFVVFLDELQAEGLVSWTTADEQPAAQVPESSRSNGPGSKASFAPPVVEKFTDMQDLVLLDPVHEVGEMGWPHARDDGVPRAASA